MRSGGFKLSFFLFTAFLLSVVARAAFADGTDSVAVGKSLCTPQAMREQELAKAAAKKSNVDEKDVFDPCHEVDLYRDGKKAAFVGAIVHSAAFAICGVSNWYPPAWTACQVGTVAAMGTDITGAMVVAVNATEKDAAFGEAMRTYTPTTVATTSGVLSNPVGVAVAGAGMYGGVKSCFGSAPCLTAVNGLIGASMWRDYGWVFPDKINAAYSKKADIMGHNLAKIEGSSQSTVSGGSAGSSGAAPGNKFSSDPKSQTPTAQEERANDIRGLAATATEDQRKLFGEFEKLSGTKVEDVLNKLAADPSLDPMQAFAAPLASKLNSDQQKSLAGMVSASKAAANRNHEKLSADPMKQNAFASTAKGKNSAGTDAGMPDFGALLGAMMPKAPEPQGSKGPVVPVKAVAPPTAEGFHNADASLFEVVEHRYQMVSKRFLEGEGVVREPASLVPKNIYLSK